MQPVPFYLVWRDGGGHPVKKHETKALAEQEAARLATENPGRHFFVLRPLCVGATTPPKVEFEVFEGE